MKLITKILLVVALLVCVCWPVQAQVPPGWEKITGQTKNYSGVTDGIQGDRQNSYAWSLAFHGGYLYCGTARNIVGVVLTQMGIPPNQFPPDVPIPTDMRGRIYRLKPSSNPPAWELFYTPPQAQGQTDIGYRMMRTFVPMLGKPTLYVGSMGIPHCQMLAIDSKQQTAVPIFTTDGMSVRAMAEYNHKFFWASEIGKQPTIWYSPDPLGE